MKFPKIEKLKSGSYRMQLQIDGERHSITGPEPKIVKQKAKELVAERERDKAAPGTVGEAFDRYIKKKSARLSPSTIRGYNKIRRNNFQTLMPIPLGKLTVDDVNDAITNDELEGYSSKTIRNAHGLLSAVLKKYRPYFRLNSDLPDKDPPNIIIPTEDQLIAIYTEAQSDKYNPEMFVVVLLASWIGLRMSEILGLKFSDLSGEYLFVSRAKVDSDNGVVVKKPKTVSGNRRIKVPNIIVESIQSLPHESEDEFVIKQHRGSVNRYFVKICEGAGVPKCRVHDLRHFSASEALSLNIPDKYQMRRMGHKTNYMLKTVYQHVMEDKEDSFADIIDERMLTLYEKCTQNAHEPQKTLKNQAS